MILVFLMRPHDKAEQRLPLNLVPMATAEPLLFRVQISWGEVTGKTDRSQWAVLQPGPVCTVTFPCVSVLGLPN